MRVAMIGSGYVGLVSGACFAEFGVDVVCVDKDAGKVASLEAGDIPIFEPGLESLVTSNRSAGRLTFTTDLKAAVASSDIVFIAVGTPSRRGDGHADLSYIYAATEEIAEALTGHTLVVTKSTVPVGTGREVARIIGETNPGADFDVASNPEFLREGAAINDFMRPDRVVVGTDSAVARDLLGRLYRPLYLLETPILYTSLETAELIKYATNAFLATKITFINQMADLCEAVGADVNDVARGMGHDGRIGSKFLHPGPGYGGSCFPKDTRALVTTARDEGVPVTIVESVVEANEARKQSMVGKVAAALDGDGLSGKAVAVLGLTFKPNTDDMRESPALDIVPGLIEAGAKVRAYDPEGMEEARKLIDGLKTCASAEEAIKGADGVVIITEWNEFRALDPDTIKSAMAVPVVVDLRNLFSPAEMNAAGIRYVCIGRPGDAT
jgi:UDPglucose 6-dehydrogenase